MSKQAYIAEVNTLRASDRLREKIAALPERQGTRPVRESAPYEGRETRQTGDTRGTRATTGRPYGRWGTIAAALVLVVGLGLAAPTILRFFSTGGQLDPPPVVTGFPIPEGIIAEGIDVSPVILDAAKEYVKEQYVACAAEPPSPKGQAVFDNWRIEQILPVYDRKKLGDLTVGVYRVDYRIHTTTPDRVILAGAREIDEEGWLMPTYPESTYLVFILNYATNHYFATIINDCRPGSELFDETLSMDISAYIAGLGGDTTPAPPVVQGAALDTLDYEALKARMTPGDWVDLQEYLPVLREGTRFRWVAEEGVTGGGGEDVTLKEYYDQRFGPDLPDGTLDLNRLTLFGFEGNGKQDLVLCFFNGGGNYLILHREGEQFYGFERGYRSFMGLQQDGVYTGSSGADYNSYSRIQFHAGYYEEQLLGQRSGDSYEIGGVAVSESYFTRWQNDLIVGDKEWYSFPPGIPDFYSSYQGMVLPVTMAPGSAIPTGVTAERSLTYDFTKALPGGDAGAYYPLLEDCYTLQNRTGQAQRLTLFYPFRGSLGMGSTFNDTLVMKSYLGGSLVGVPAVTTDRGALNYGFDAAYLHAGPPLSTQDSWDALADALGGEDYLNASVSQDRFTLRDLPVYAYAVTGMEGYEKLTPDAERSKLPNLRLDLKLADPEHTQIFTYGLHCYYGKAQFGYIDGCDVCAEGTTHYIILVGGDLTGYTMSGWQDTSWSEPLEGLTAKLTPLSEVTGDAMDRYLGGALSRCLEDYLATRSLPLVTDAAGAPTAELHNAVARYILSNYTGEPLLRALYGEEPPAGVMPNLSEAYELSLGVENILYDVLTAPRVLYYEGSVTVPAGGSTTVRAVSYCHPTVRAEHIKANGAIALYYDFSPTLGGGIPAERLKVMVRPAAGQSTINTNLGTPQPEGTWVGTRVYGGLDPATESYFFDVRETG